MTMNPEDIGAVLGRIPSGCSILTLTRGTRSTGVLLSWVQQASFEPPAITFCVKHGRPVQTLLEPGARFVLNLVGEDPAAMFRHFGRGFALEDDAFAGIQTLPSDFGPVLPSCPGQLGCSVHSQHNAGDHDVYLAQILAARTTGEFKPYVHIRRNGLSY